MLRKVFRGRFTFLAVSAIQKALPLLILPFLTSILGPEKYGEVAVLISCFTLASMTFGLGLETITYRYGKRVDSEAGSFIVAAAVLQRFVPILVGLAVASFVYLLNVRVGGATPLYVALAVLAASVYCSAWQFPTSTARVSGRLYWFFSLAISYSVLLAASKLLFVVGFDLGVLGWAMADLTASTALFILTFRDFLPYLRAFRRNPGRFRIRRPLRLGSPLIVNAASQWVSGSLDRILIAAILGSAATGQYALAAQVVTIGGVVITELTKYIQPHLALERDREAGEVLARVAPRQIFLVSSVCIATALIGAFLAPVVFGPAFGQLGILSALMALPLILTGLSFLGIEYLSITKGETRNIALISTLMAGVSVVLNIVLLPVLGMSGAVWSLALTSLLTFSLVWVPIIRKDIPLISLPRFFWSVPVSAIIVLLIAWVA